ERAIAQFGANAGGGFVNQGNSEYVIRVIGTGADVAALGGLVVAKRDSTPVLLRQVAHVGLAAKPARGSAGLDGHDAVLFSVQKHPQADTRAVTRAVGAALNDLQASLPAGIRIDRVIFKQSDFISAALDNVGYALAESIVVVAVILFLFLANMRTALIS